MTQGLYSCRIFLQDGIVFLQIQYVPVYIINLLDYIANSDVVKGYHARILNNFSSLGQYWDR